jgi:hypothetical protein
MPHAPANRPSALEIAVEATSHQDSWDRVAVRCDLVGASFIFANWDFSPSVHDRAVDRANQLLELVRSTRPKDAFQYEWKSNRLGKDWLNYIASHVG